MKENSMYQNHQILKERYPKALLLHRIGDFYETYGQDAIDLAGICGISVVTRNNADGSVHELAGFPIHAINQYLAQLNESRNVLIAQREPQIEWDQPKVQGQKVFVITMVGYEDDKMYETHQIFATREGARAELKEWLLDFAWNHDADTWSLDEHTQDMVICTTESGERMEIIITEDTIN